MKRVISVRSGSYQKTWNESVNELINKPGYRLVTITAGPGGEVAWFEFDSEREMSEVFELKQKNL